MAKAIEIKPEETFARNYVDRLILEQLTEMESAVKLGELADRLSGKGIGLSTVRSLLASNPERFTYHERRWIPAARLNGTGRPFAQAMMLVLEGFGSPMPMSLLLQEIGRIRHAEPEEIENTVRRLAESDETFVVSGEFVSLTKWSFVAHDEPFARALALNGITLEEVEIAKPKLEGIDWRSEGSVVEAVKRAAPVKLKVLGAVAWQAMNSDDPRSILIFDSREFYAHAINVPGYVYAPDGTIYPESEAKKWVTVAIKLADRLAPQVDVDDAAPIEIKAEDAHRLADKIAASDQTITATRLLEENYEITPSNKTFPDDMANLMVALKLSDKIVWVGGDRFQKAGLQPDFISEVPEPFQFVKSTMVDEEGELIDIELTDDGLSSSLRKLLSHPLATDVLDEDVLPAPKTMPEQLRLVLKSIHRELGTFPLAQIPTGWLTVDPKVQEAVFVDPQGREMQVWINQTARLMYNLFDWWFEQAVESGAVFTLTKTTRPNVFDFAWMDQPDPVVYISSQRMEELRNIGSRADEMSTLDILVEVMGHWPKGADYLTILAEVNVVRRSSRRLVASLLSSYQCFYQRSGSPVWHFDQKKIDLGFDKTKRKFVKK
ncbi:MAG: hypothetical protein ACHQ50_14295 [Fimbriimonadales bacterium]